MSLDSGSLVPTRLGAALALLTFGGLLVVVQVIVAAARSSAGVLPLRAHERHMGLDVADSRHVREHQQLHEPEAAAKNQAPMPMTPSPAESPEPLLNPHPGDSVVPPPNAQPGESLMYRASSQSAASSTPPDPITQTKVAPESMPPSPPAPPVPASPSPQANTKVASPVPIGANARFQIKFARKYPKKDTGIECLDLKRSDIPAGCGEACSAEVRQRPTHHVVCIS